MCAGEVNKPFALVQARGKDVSAVEIQDDGSLLLLGAFCPVWEGFEILPSKEGAMA